MCSIDLQANPGPNRVKATPSKLESSSTRGKKDYTYLREDLDLLQVAMKSAGLGGPAPSRK